METKIETRDRYRYWLSIATRWMDGDPYGHVNNVQYYSFIDTVVTTMLIDRQVLRGPHWDAIGLTIESQCNYHQPITFPEAIDAGLRIGRIGNSSLRYEVALFRQGDSQPAATAHFVHVFVDPDSRRPVPLVAAVREAMTELMLPV
ncbi:MAG: thioesterase [Hydrocarboniphaga sp.]|uniref:acyl-CoA thioesterase n=1 Tax=Hydrocarboniphaga sp. TaxID=2033016 RepID=UPI0026197B27|nr:thioesterase family protein [Hydrocarboniphaga sp.]MDB5968031.1 thioesterase [Hydrocarboniphaga sp.]